MKRLAFYPAFVFLLTLGVSLVYAADAGDVTLTVSGIEGVEAISSAVSGDAMVNQTLVGNRLAERDVISTSILQGTFQDGRGILSINQASGNINNQANVRVLAIGDGDVPLQDYSLAISSRSIKNTVISTGGEYENRITNSFGGGVGIVGVNQAAGSLNQQLNVLVLGIGVALGPDVVALGDADLGGTTAENSVSSGGHRADIITDSFTGFRGIAQVNQSSGDLNIVGNSIGFSFIRTNVP
jgi:hypothetical protein